VGDGGGARAVDLRAVPGGVAPGDGARRVLGARGWWPVGVGVVWLGLVVAALAELTFQVADAITFVTLLALAALATLAARPARRCGDREWGRGLVVVWTLAAALVLPPIYPLVAHLPLCLLRPTRQVRPAQATVGWPPPAPDAVDLAGERRQNAGGLTWRGVYEGVALGVAGAAASWLHGLLAPPHGPYDATDLTGSPGRLAGLAAAVAGYAVVRELLLPGPARGRGWRRGSLGVPAARADGLSPGTTLLVTAELCAAVTVATLWTTNPLLVLAAVPPVLLLARSLPPEELLAAARTDPKTGLANASWWRQVADAELARARRAGRPLSVLLVDIDHFKRVNDRYGHLFGDAVLVAVAEALRAATRPWDLVGRFGGEEFVVLLADVDLPTAAEIAERIRRQVAAARCPLDRPHLDGGAVGVTVSIGVAVCEPPAGLPESLEAADAALYRAKAEGRDRVGVAGPATAVAVVEAGAAPVAAQAARSD
jgi:diguanylate cyclase (GGDEF)-like protein